MRIFRLCRKPFAKSPLDGKGGLVVAGRWHTPRRLVAYASDSLALASLEILVHCDFDLLPRDLVAVEVDVPSGVKIAELAIRKLPRTWRKFPAPVSLQRLGNGWLDGGKSCLLRVPSAVVPEEHNYLINPAHRDMKKIRVVRKFDFRLDPRLGSA